MKGIMLYIFCSLSFGVMSQDLVFLSDTTQKSKTIEYFNGNLLLRRGNMIRVDKYIDKKVVSYDWEEFFIDKSDIKSYYFSDSPENVLGWLLEDKYRHKSLYFSRELVLVKDEINDTIFVEKTKNCGFDVFVFSCKCGFSDAYYDFSKGKFFFYERNLILKDDKMILNVLTGDIEK